MRRLSSDSQLRNDFLRFSTYWKITFSDFKLKSQILNWEKILWVEVLQANYKMTEIANIDKNALIECEYYLLSLDNECHGHDDSINFIPLIRHGCKTDVKSLASDLLCFWNGDHEILASLETLGLALPRLLFCHPYERLIPGVLVPAQPRYFTMLSTARFSWYKMIPVFHSINQITGCLSLFYCSYYSLVIFVVSSLCSRFREIT